MYKSYYPKASEIERKWVLVDANGQALGRIATRIAHVLLGKHKPTFTPGVEMGDYVVVVNAEKVTATGTKTSVMLRRPVRGGFRMPSALRVEHHFHDSPSITPRQIMLVVPLRAHKPNVGRCEILHQLSATNLSAECRTYRCSHFSTLSLNGRGWR